MEDKNIEIPEKILKKLNHLMERQKNPGSIGEAAAVANLISELLSKYNLSMSRVEDKLKNQENEIHVTKGKFDDHQTPYDGSFAQDMLTAIAFFNFCKLYYHPTPKEVQTTKNSKGEFTLIGKKHNVEIAYYLFDYCMNNIKRLFDEHWARDKKLITEKKNIHKRNYYKGAVIVLTKRFLEMRQKEENPQPEPKPNRSWARDFFDEDDFNEDDFDMDMNEEDDEDEMLSNVNDKLMQIEECKKKKEEWALMVQENEEALSEKEAELFSNVKKRSKMKVGRDKDALTEGLKDGASLQLHAGVQGTPVKQQGQLTKAPLQIQNK